MDSGEEFPVNFIFKGNGNHHAELSYDSWNFIFGELSKLVRTFVGYNVMMKSFNSLASSEIIIQNPSLTLDARFLIDKVKNEMYPQQSTHYFLEVNVVRN